MVARTEHPAAQRRQGIERELASTRGAPTMISACQEQLPSLYQLHSRMPEHRHREAAPALPPRSLDAELHDAETAPPPDDRTLGW